MRTSRLTSRRVTGCSEIPLNQTRCFSGSIAKGLRASIPSATNASDAVLRYAGLLIAESGLNEPPFRPHHYAQLRGVRQIIDKEMRLEGRLVPFDRGFLIEIRKDRSQQRKNFTCAHELAHTFFYEALPELKRSRLAAGQAQTDPEEELLCNIAAAELLMPQRVFYRVVRDFVPSASSLIEIANLFDVSLAATALRVVSLSVWDCSFILWARNSGQIIPRWLAGRTSGLMYSPNLHISAVTDSGVYHTLNTGEDTSTLEWLYLNDSAKRCRVVTIRLPHSRSLLSCVFHNPASEPSRSYRFQEQSLPLTYDCECGGTRWRLFVRNGQTYAARCRATIHAKSPSAH